MKYSAVWWGGKWVLAFAIARWTALDVPVQALVIFMAIDYATGLAGAAARRELSSRVGLTGLMTKTATLLLILAIHVAEWALHRTSLIGPTIAFAYAINECVSITENCAKLGVRIPTVVLQMLVCVRTLQPKMASEDELRELADRPGQDE